MTDLEKWELRLSAVLNRVDAALEENFGEKYPRRPTRPPAGATSNAKYDGLFGLASAFSLGYASGDGPNYVITLHVVTFSPISHEAWEELRTFTAEKLQIELDAEFLPQKLVVSRDADVFRITGDLNFTT